MSIWAKGLAMGAAPHDHERDLESAAGSWVWPDLHSSMETILGAGASSILMIEQVAAPLTRVLLVASHDLLADLLAFGLSRVGLDVCVAEVRSTERVLKSAAVFRPNIVLLHVSDEACVSLVGPLIRLGARVLVLTAGVRDNDLPAECLERGAVGLFDEGQPFDDLVAQIRDAALGRTVIEPAQRDALLCAMYRHRASQREHTSALAGLSAREREVLGELMNGRAAEEIAHVSFVSLATVRTHIRSILSKLGVNSQLAAVVLAQKCGWTPDKRHIA